MSGSIAGCNTYVGCRTSPVAPSCVFMCVWVGQIKTTSIGLRAYVCCVFMCVWVCIISKGLFGTELVPWCVHEEKTLPHNENFRPDISL